MTDNLTVTTCAVPETADEASALAEALRAQLPATFTLQTACSQLTAKRDTYDDSLFIDGVMTARTGRTYQVAVVLEHDDLKISARTTAHSCRRATERVTAALRGELAEAWLVPETRWLRYMLAGAVGAVAMAAGKTSGWWYENRRALLRTSLCALVQFELAEGSSERLAAEALADDWQGTPAELLMAARSVGASRDQYR